MARTLYQIHAEPQRAYKTITFNSSGQFTVPQDWNNNDFTIDGWGPGGNSAAGTTTAAGAAGGSGGWSRLDPRVTPHTLIPGTTYNITIGAAGSGTATSFGALLVANAGGNASGITGGTGATAGTGDQTQAGTTGAAGASLLVGGAGGTGAPGPLGLGAVGGIANTGETGAAGGGGADGGSPGASGSSGNGGVGGNNASGTGGGAGGLSSGPVSPLPGTAGGGGGGGTNSVAGSAIGAAGSAAVSGAGSGGGGSGASAGASRSGGAAGGYGASGGGGGQGTTSGGAAGASAAGGIIITYLPTTNQEFTVASWSPVLDIPQMQPVGLRAWLQEFGTGQPVIPPASLPRLGWREPLSEPPVRPWLLAAQQQVWGGPVAPIVVTTVSIGWFEPLSEPVRLPAALPASEQRADSEPVRPPQPPVQFYEPLSEPYPATRGLPATEQQAWAGPIAPPQPPAQFFEALSEPVRQPVALPADQQQFAAAPVAPPVAPLFPHEPLSEPTPRPWLLTAQQQAWTGPIAPVSAAVTVSIGWFGPLSEPVRFASFLTAWHVAAAGPVAPPQPPAQFFEPLSEPPGRPWIPAAQQIAWTGPQIAPAAPAPAIKYEPLSEPPLRPWLLPAQQQAWAGPATKPIYPVKLYPPLNEPPTRPWLPVTQQRAYTGPELSQPNKVPPLGWLVGLSEPVRQPLGLLACQQLVWASEIIIPPPPEPVTPPTLGSWRGQVGINWLGMALVGDAYTGVLGLSDFGSFTEYGNIMRLLVTSPPIHEDRKRVFIRRFEVDVQSGVGTAAITQSRGSPGPVSIMVSWSAVPTPPSPVTVLSYTLQWSPHGLNQWQTIQGLGLSTVIGNLTSGATYDFQVAALYSNGLGPYSPIVIGGPCLGLPAGTLTIPAATNPNLMLDWSGNGGMTWSEQIIWRQMGASGQYKRRLRWLNLGQSRSWVLRLTCTDPVRRAIIGTYLDVGVGGM